MPGEVTLNSQLGKEHLPVTGGSQVAYVLVEATPTEMMAQVRMPLNFAIVLDRSGSMKGSKLNAVKQAVQMLIDQMADTDTISVVAFDDGVQIIVPAQPAMDKAGIKMAVDRIRDGGGTTMSLGMSTGLNELRKYYSPTSVNRMIILSDGVTYGDTDRCRALADDAGRQGINIYPLGIGSDWDEDLLDNIGRRSGGLEAEFIRQPGDALHIFQQQFQSAAAVAVRNAQLLLHLSAGITPKKAVKVLPQISDLGQSVLSDRQVVVPLGDLEKDTSQAVLFELMIEPKPAGVFRIAVAELAYDVPTMSRMGEQLRADIVVGFSQDTNETQAVNALVMNYAEKANAHRLVTKVLEEYKATGKVTTRLAPNVTRVLDQETQAALEQLSAGQAISSEQVKSIGNKTRKLTQRLEDA
ncbi:MAG TPA: VWA domain-containing protein [Ktedonobacterales bacterium]|nr:VWA domain-containing protein [Ktedonobacterales bacterium]